MDLNSLHEYLSNIFSNNFKNLPIELGYAYAYALVKFKYKVRLKIIDI